MLLLDIREKSTREEIQRKLHRPGLPVKHSDGGCVAPVGYLW